jgi:hypothetical protein
MMATWALIGVIAGLNASIALGRTWTDYLAHILANVILLPVLGLILGPLTTRCRDAVLGAVMGLAVGSIAFPDLDLQDAMLRGTMINVGGLLGATIVPLAGLIIRGFSGIRALLTTG